MTQTRGRRQAKMRTDECASHVPRSRQRKGNAPENDASRATKKNLKHISRRMSGTGQTATVGEECVEPVSPKWKWSAKSATHAGKTK